MDKYLLSILKEVNTIIIPEIGALTITNHDTGEILFMPYLKHDDGKLSAFIAKKEGINELEAKNIISKYVRDIEATINKGDSYDMYQFGSFEKVDDEIVFKQWSKSNEDTRKSSKEDKKKDDKTDKIIVAQPSPDPKISKEKHELVEENKLKQEEEVKEVKTDKETSKLPIDKEAQKQKNQEKLNKLKKVHKKEKKQKKAESNSRKVILIVLVVLIISSVGLIGYLHFSGEGHNQTIQHSETEVNNTTINEGDDTSYSEGSESDANSEETISPSADDLNMSEMTTTEVENNNQGTGPYHIVVGFFTESQHVDEALTRLKNQGYNGYTFDHDGGKRVCAKSYNSLNAAYNALGEFPKAWVLRQ